TTLVFSLSLHDALPISSWASFAFCTESLISCTESKSLSNFKSNAPFIISYLYFLIIRRKGYRCFSVLRLFCLHMCQYNRVRQRRSEEHTSELQSRFDLV